MNITLISHSWGGSRGGSGGLVEPSKMKQLEKIFDHTFSCEKGLVEQQHQLDNAGRGGGGGAFKDGRTSNYREFSVSETCFFIRITVDTYLHGR